MLTSNMEHVEERVILVDEADREIGTAPKLAAHKAGQLHRAFSIFILDNERRLLLQRRADVKYHSGGLWSNTCCGHPRPGEGIVQAGERRLFEEMGFGSPLRHLESFKYRARLSSDIWEHEIDHVLVGRFGGSPLPNPSEVSDWRWDSLEDVARGLQRSPDQYTVWFASALQKLNGLM